MKATPHASFPPSRCFASSRRPKGVKQGVMVVQPSRVGEQAFVYKASFNCWARG